MVFIENHNSPLERGAVARVATMLRQVCFACTTSLERLLHTPGQVPVLACTRPDTVWGAKDQRTTVSRPCRSKSGVETGLDMKEVVPDARDAQQHDPVLSESEILCSTK
jgi:hypothetical protein